MTFKSTNSIDNAFKIMSQQNQKKVVDKLKSLPLEMQFVPHAIEQGYGATFGITTSNAAEVSGACRVRRWSAHAHIVSHPQCSLRLRGQC